MDVRDRDVHPAQRGPSLVEDAPVDTLVRGGQPVLSDVVSAWSPMLFQLTASLPGGHPIAEDVVRRSWLSALRELTRSTSPPRLKAWVMRAWLTEVQSRGLVSAGPALDVPGSPGPSVETRPFPARRARDVARSLVGAACRLARADRRARLRHAAADAVHGLPDEERLVVSLRDVARCQVAEIAWMLDIPPVQTRALLHAGRAIVRKALDELLVADLGSGPQAR